MDSSTTSPSSALPSTAEVTQETVTYVAAIYTTPSGLYKRVMFEDLAHDERPLISGRGRNMAIRAVHDMVVLQQDLTRLLTEYVAAGIPLPPATFREYDLRVSLDIDPTYVPVTVLVPRKAASAE